MPDPRPLGNVARTVLSSITDQLNENQDEFFEVVLRIHGGDVQGAIQALKEIAARNNVAVQTLTFLLADKQKRAEDLLISAKLRQERQK